MSTYIRDDVNFELFLGSCNIQEHYFTCQLALHFTLFYATAGKAVLAAILIGGLVLESFPLNIRL
jgi:hypothetical protein